MVATRYTGSAGGGTVITPSSRLVHAKYCWLSDSDKGTCGGQRLFKLLIAYRFGRSDKVQLRLISYEPGLGNARCLKAIYELEDFIRSNQPPFAILPDVTNIASRPTLDAALTLAGHISQN